MRQKGLWLSIAIGFLLASTGGLLAANQYKVVNGPDKFYYGHISYTEVKADGKDPVVIREGQPAAEVAVLNLPVGPGDTIRTPEDRRCEIQFDSGTIVRLDFDTDLKIETILAQSLSSPARLSNLALGRGRIYIMYREYDSREMLQVLTPLAALKLNHNTVAMIRAAADGSTDAQVKVGKANVMFGGDEKRLQKETLKGQERITLLSASQFQRAAYLAGSDFELWNDDINARFEELHKGQNLLPKPLQKLPPAVFYFAQRYGNIYGEWIWDDMYGYVWRPFLNRMDYPWGWGPYYYGRWSLVGNQMFWVPEEPWGWIPYHLGIWQWDKKLGWVWLPGSLFAPAWVDWAFFYGYYSWRPWGLFDWFDGFYMDFFFAGGMWNWGYGPGILPSELGPPYAAPGKPTLSQLPRTTLQQPPSAFVIPRELKGPLKNVQAAFKRGDPRMIESAKQVSSQAVFVPRAELNSSRIQEKAVPWDKVPRPEGVTPGKGKPGVSRAGVIARQDAARSYRGIEFGRMITRSPEIAGRTQRASLSPAGTPTPAPVSRQAGPAWEPGRTGPALGGASRPHFLDWNPDVRIARELGVRIEYSSQKNEIRCPELNLSSKDRETAGGLAPRLTSGGISYGPASSVGDGTNYGGGASSAGPASERGPATSRAQGSAREGASSGGGGGKIKN